MAEAVDAQAGGVAIVEGPADVVVRAHVVHPGAARVDAEALAHREVEQP